MFGQSALAGTVEYAGRVQTEWDRTLRGREGAKKYQEMQEGNATVGGIMNAIEIALSSVVWGFEAPEDADPEHPAMIEAVKLGDSWLGDMSIPWSETVTAIAAYLGYGYQPLEVQWKYRRGEDADPSSFYDDNRIGLRKLLPIPQVTVDRWLFSEDGSLEGLVQLLDNGKTAEVPIGKLCIVKTRYHHGSPEGRSILRPAYPNYYYLTHFEEMEAIGVERDAVGFPVIYLPLGADKNTGSTEYQAALDVVRNIKRDDQQGLVIPPPYGESEAQRTKLELLGTPGTKLFDDDKIIRRHQWQIGASAMTQFLQMGSGETGTYALSRDSTDMFVMSVHSRLDQMASYLNRFVFRLLFRANVVPGLEDYPVLAPGRVTEGDIVALMDTVSKLTLSGLITVNDETENWARTQVGAPELPEREEGEIEEELPEEELTPIEELEGLE